MGVLNFIYVCLSDIYEIRFLKVSKSGGKIQTRSWEKDGIKRYITEIYADNIQMLGKKPENKDAVGSALAETVAEPVSNGVQAPPPEKDDLPF